MKDDFKGICSAEDGVEEKKSSEKIAANYFIMYRCTHEKGEGQDKREGFFVVSLMIRLLIIAL